MKEYFFRAPKKIFRNFFVPPWGSVSGLKLKSVKLQKEDGYANLVVDFIPLGKLGKELSEEEKAVKIEWVTDDEFQGEYTFTLNK